MAALGIILMGFGGIWALAGIVNAALSLGRLPGTEAVGVTASVLLFVFPGFVLIALGAIVQNQAPKSPASALPGARRVGTGPCRSCGRAVALDTPRCEHCGAVEPSLMLGR